MSKLHIKQHRKFGGKTYSLGLRGNTKAEAEATKKRGKDKFYTRIVRQSDGYTTYWRKK